MRRLPIELQALAEIRAHRRRILDHAFLGDGPERGSRDGAGERIAAERASVLAGLQYAHDRPAAKDCGHGIEAAAERLAEQRHVGLDAFVFFSQELAGAAQPRLDFVEDQDDAFARAKLADRAHVTRRRHDHAGLALDRLHEDARRCSG